MVIGLTPGSVLCWMNKLTNGTSTSHKILERCLHSIMSEDEAIETLDVAIKEGVLVYTPNAKSAPASVKRGLLSFTQKLSKQRAKTDPYCFECHLPTSGLVQKCIMCVRSFHVECQRKNPLRPNYSVPSDRCQQYRFPLNESDMEESSDQEASRSHNIGIFFGTKCEEYNATKWLLRDITHDLREISRCSDCFRHSIESNRSDFWFAKPCTQRHELVYAKQSGYPHWPAKVIRVMSKKNNTYDVRFFGGSHSRALVPARDILPIDTDTSKLKIKSSRQYNNAMRELMCHQMLLHHPIYSFSFHADPREAENIINSALPHYMEPCSRSAKRARLATPKLNTRRSTAETTPNLPQRVLPRRRCRIAQGPENLQDSTFQMASSVIPSLAPELQVSLLPEVQVSLAPEVQVSLAPEVQVSIEDYNELMREVLHLNAQLSQKKAEVDIKREELKAVKRKRWCQLCLEEAQFDCCFMASYCSVVCQRRDKRRHQTNCNLQEKT
ncbi:zinc finger MYND domain-containing protein 11 isoform X3 [Drosophila sulfurigaster albostrigata]|uniref:zinc finger MYND domain-containing protein 11 isoform X3 n=1 Tax=Drosophila sulfurigaster albostrigata TaxID=89887 RepID=UPI002D21DF38|nr:zinc finger MYND domain-containing protein 11 isoform X3 [Drosophila sulfurigaster albostrigata]